MQVIRTKEFENWLNKESSKIQALVESRVFRIEHYDHLGDAKHLGDGLSELRWKNGLRVYFARVGARVVLLIHGGGKNAQKNDIKKARALLERYSDSPTQD
jgi:putative addiction module killer protein